MNMTEIYLNKDLQDIDNEIWKDIPDWEGSYQVSNMGRVKSLNRITTQNRKIKGQILNFYPHKQGFLYVCLSKRGKHKKYLVMQLVARNFIKDLVGFRCFKHKNGNRLDNRVENIEYDNRNENFHLGLKRCNICKNEFLLDNFYLSVNGVYDKNCKECAKADKKIYNKKNREKVLERTKRYYHKNKEICNKKNREYYQNNKEKVNRKDQETKRLREKTDIPYRLRRQYKNLLYCAFKKQGILKDGRSCKDFIGCSFEDFKKHIESQFESWMTWDNYGKDGWHFGHIQHCELFDFLNESHIKACFHYSNIKPQFWRDNITTQDFLPDGRRARDLTREQKMNYLKSVGMNI